MEASHILATIFTMLLVASLLGAPPLYPQLALAHTDSTLANPITQNNWEVSWVVTTEHGLGIYNVKYKGTDTTYDLVLTDARLSSVYVDYSSGDLVDELWDTNNYHVHKVDVTNGFRLEGHYYVGCTETQWNNGQRTGCYKYIQEWWFFSDGTFRPWLRIYGPGLIGQPGYGTNPTYEARWRFNTGIFQAADDGHQYYDSSWTYTLTENQKSDTAPSDPSGYEWRVFDWPSSGESFYIDPFSADNARWWSLRHYAGEEEIPLGTCTNCDNFSTQTKGSPEYYRGTESISDSSSGPGYDNAHWYLSLSTWVDEGCSTTNPCYPGATWKAVSFP